MVCGESNEINGENFRSLYWPSSLYLNLSRALTLDKKIEVIYATSAVLLYIFHTTAFLIKRHGEK